MVNTLQNYHFISEYANKMSQNVRGLTLDSWVLMLHNITKSAHRPE